MADIVSTTMPRHALISVNGRTAATPQATVGRVSHLIEINRRPAGPS